MAAASTAFQVLVSPLLGIVFDNLRCLIRTEFGLVWGVNRELEKLSSTLSTIQDVLDDAEIRQITNKPIHNWLRKLKDVAYDAEDVLDEFSTLKSDHQLELTGSDNSCNNIHEVLTNSLSSYFDLKRISFRRRISKRIKEVNEKFDEIAKERFKFHLSTHLTPEDVDSRVIKNRQTTSFLVEPQVYGREEEKEYIVNQLLNNNTVDDADVCVGAILGMGGLGKTTLAQMVHHDDRIVKHFEVRCWVCVSEHFEPITLFKAIIESFGGSTQDLQNLDPLQHRLQEGLGGKRFLVVLDDVWNEDQAKWEILKSSLTCGGKGSSVIVTTRLEKVASMTATLFTCRPNILSDEDCWSLFRHRAFDMRNNYKENHPGLEAIGKQIVKKCGGIPLAAKALGGLLRFERKENEWLYVRDSHIWDLPQNKADAILPALRLSYNHLPLHLRQCFAYCSIFPKDYKIKRKKLIYLWMANGFVQSKGQNLELEDVGDAFFNDLSSRSFFQDFEKDEDDNISSCKMHDLIHDLACSIMRDECLVLQVGKENTSGRRSTNTKHLSLIFLWYLSSKSSFPEISQHVRTLLVKSDHWLYKPAPPLQLIFSHLKCLRALDLRKMDISTIPDSIGNLKHLRYLNLSQTKITSLPNKSFCSLKNLQILKLNKCSELQVLPEDMWKMSNLRHLEIRECYSLIRTPIRMGKLTSLQTLSIFIVGKESGHGITELHGLNCLRGELEIQGLEHVKSSIDARNANLMKRQNLTSLTLCWSSASRMRQNDTSKLVRVGESLQPHQCLKRLHINGFGGTNLPSWLRNFSSLPNLVEISLVDCERCEHLSSLGELPFLKVLKVSRMNSVKCIGDEFYQGDRHHQTSVCFPSLEKLDISFLCNLEEFSPPSWLPSSSSGSSHQLEMIRGGRGGGGEVQVLAFPSLRIFYISKCPKLRSLISLPLSLKELNLLECNEMVLSVALKNLPPHLSDLWIGVSDEVISFPVVDPMIWMRLRNLTYLSIYKCPKLRTLPKELMENLTALTHLTIAGCDEFTNLPEGMQYLNSLTFFDIIECRSLKHLHKGIRYLTSLQVLFIFDCPELEFSQEDDNDFQQLMSLRSLLLWSLPKMTSLPTVLACSLDNLRVPTLKNLNIGNCSALTILPEWITSLTSLQCLEIEECENLKFLPHEGLERLTNLQKLTIEKCHPDLHRRCEEYKGEYWQKISHIPELLIIDR